MAGGEHFSLALTHDRKRIYAFGRADYGQLGIGVIVKEGDFRDTPMLVKFPKPVFISKIDAGDRHGMAICEEQVYTWGFNEEGTTGHPSVKDEDVFRPRLLNFMDSIKKDKTAACHVHGISGGGQHSLVLVKRYKACDA